MSGKELTIMLDNNNKYARRFGIRFFNHVLL